MIYIHKKFKPIVKITRKNIEIIFTSPNHTLTLNTNKLKSVQTSQTNNISENLISLLQRIRRSAKNDVAAEDEVTGTDAGIDLSAGNLNDDSSGGGSGGRFGRSDRYSPINKIIVDSTRTNFFGCEKEKEIK